MIERWVMDFTGLDPLGTAPPASMDIVRGRSVDSVGTLEQVVVLGLVADSVDSQYGLVTWLIAPGGADRSLGALDGASRHA